MRPSATMRSLPMAPSRRSPCIGTPTIGRAGAPAEMPFGNDYDEKPRGFSELQLSACGSGLDVDQAAARQSAVHRWRDALGGPRRRAGIAGGDRLGRAPAARLQEIEVDGGERGRLRR